MGQHPAFTWGPTGWWQHSQPACGDACVLLSAGKGTGPHMVMQSSRRPRLGGRQGSLRASLPHSPVPHPPCLALGPKPTFPESHTTAHWPEIPEPTARALQVTSAKPSCSAGGYHSPPLTEEHRCPRRRKHLPQWCSHRWGPGSAGVCGPEGRALR